MKVIDVLVIGSGPAGYTAALYAIRSGLNVKIISGNLIGGLLTTTTVVENYPGFENGIDGNLLVSNMKKQVENLGVDIIYDYVNYINYDKFPYQIHLESDNIIVAKTIIIASGASHKKLNIKTEKIFENRGISYCATCDGFFYKNKDVIVIGGGDSACEEAIFLSNICNKVYMLIRGNSMKASNIMKQRVLSNDKIEILYNEEVDEFVGDENSEKLVSIKTKSNKYINISAAFIAIGHTPNSLNMIGIGSVKLDIDSNGYIITNDTITNIKGVYAAGDVQDYKYRQAITSAASGCISALNAKGYISLIDNK